MLRIGEFSKIAKITVKTLHHYDEIGLLKPHHINPNNNYRYYKVSQLNHMWRITAFKNMGLSLEEISHLLSTDTSTPEMIASLQGKHKELTQSIQHEQEKLSKVYAFIQHLKEESPMEVTIKTLPKVIIASMRTVIPEYVALHQVAPAMGEKMKQHGAVCAQPFYCFNVYHDEEYKEKDIDVEICEAVVDFCENKDGIIYKIIPEVPQAACLYHKGPYENLSESYAIIMPWIEENKYTIIDKARESFIDGCWNKDDPSEWLTEIQIPVKK